MKWTNAGNIISRKYKCGYCASPLASQKGFLASGRRNGMNLTVGWIYICHSCEKPTFFDYYNNQTPGPIIGTEVKHIPKEEIENLFNEAKACFSINAYTSSVMCCRKLLMNISVSEGAKEGASFAQYVTYLEENNYIPPNGKKWVDSIRKLGNEANHKIKFKTPKEAGRILKFTEMLLRFIYELPGIMEETELESED
ncbi:DUF4145 domain-containing protein [Flavobacteriales bacterium]|jgi:hypothetical protein|nr:DUF4145 domain-containing protein [Flavobacteriales bacterium]